MRATPSFAEATEGRRPPKLRRSEGGATRTSRLLAVVAAAWLVGCAAYERAEIMIDPDPARSSYVERSPWEVRARSRQGGGRRAEVRSSSPGWGLSARTRRGGRSAPAGQVRLTLGSGAPTDREALNLVELALGRVPAGGGPRGIVEGLAYFSRAEDPRFIVHLERRNGLGGETWVIDRAWALRRLDGGAVLVWQGEFGPVVRTLSLVLPPPAARR